MQGSLRLGFVTAAAIAVMVLGYHFFGTRHDEWFVRAAQQNAVRCLTKIPCPHLTAQGAIIPNAPPPLGVRSPCAHGAAWQELKPASNGQTSIVLTCTDGAGFLYHMGGLADRRGGSQQWTRCAEPSCTAERHQILKLTSAS